MSQNKIEKMMNQLTVAYSDEGVKRVPELQDIVFEAAKDLEKSQNTKLVASKFCSMLPQYYLSYKDQFPKALITLYYQLKKDAEIYKGTATSAIMFPLWFG
ncbi:bacteriocin immunity protein [Enterococcus larvae]|uniref:bacteriocin immunity protein n=1 Tax=Enterococcus larvae TaxID=2794352 RepID=UPI003F41054D